MNKLSKILGASLMIASLMSGTTAFAADSLLTERSFFSVSTKAIDAEIEKGATVADLNEALYLALRYGRDPKLIDHLIEKGADVNGTNAGHRAHIFNATYYATYEQLKAFLAHEPDINVVDGDGRTPFIRSFYGQQDMRAIKLMLAHGFDPKATDIAGTNAVYTAAYRNTLPVVKFLVEELGLDPLTISASSGENAIFRATNGPDAEEIIAYLREKGADHKVISYSDQNIVSYMAERSRRSDHLELFKSFVADGISPHDKDEEGRDALLNAAYRNDDLDFIKYLVESGSDVSGTDNAGRDALNIAAYRNSEKVVTYFIESGLDVNTPDNAGATALLWSTTRNNGSIKIIKALLDAGADASAVDENGNNAVLNVVSRDVSSSTKKGSVKEILQLLVAAGATLDATTKKGETALIKAAQFGHHLDTLAYLIDNGLDVNAQNSYKLTPLMYAAMKATNVEVLEYLLSKGAKTDTVDDFGDTAVDLVKENELLQGTNALEVIQTASK